MSRNHVQSNQNTFTQCSNCNKPFTTDKHMERAKPDICADCKQAQEEKESKKHVESPFTSEELLKNE